MTTKKYLKKNAELETLLDLDGEIFPSASQLLEDFWAAVEEVLK